MTDSEIEANNATVRLQMNGAASAVLNSMLRNFHKTGARVVLLNPPISSHKVGYRLEQGTITKLRDFGRTYGLRAVTDSYLEVAS